MPPVTTDEKLFDRCWSAKLEADWLLDVRKAEQALMAPKLQAKSGVLSNNLSPEEVFQARAISAQIGWLETPVNASAAAAISNVELLLALNAQPESISHQLKVFQAHEQGLMATWETGDQIICVPRAYCYG